MNIMFLCRYLTTLHCTYALSQCEVVKENAIELYIYTN